MNCGRCKKEMQIIADDWEACWYCMGPLCPECWEEYGECGHPEAAEFVEDVRRVLQMDESD